MQRLVKVIFKGRTHKESVVTVCQNTLRAYSEYKIIYSINTYSECMQSRPMYTQSVLKAYSKSILWYIGTILRVYFSIL